VGRPVLSPVAWILALALLAAGLVHLTSAPEAEAAARNKTKAKAKKDAKPPTLKTEFGTLEIFPADNPWNQEIADRPVDPLSATYIASIGADKPLHADFGTEWQGAPNGIPYVAVDKKQKKVSVTFEYADESDKGPYPIPDDAPIEGGPEGKGDRHILILSVHEKKLYELFHAFKTEVGWRAGSGAIFDLTANPERPAGWTSADAAGLPIFPGLVRYDEAVEQGEIRHALRFTVARTQKAYVAPARHFASKHTDTKLPPMGLRVRLKADYDLGKFPKTARVILQALKTYGMILADNGSDWYISGAPHAKWNDDDLHALKQVCGRDLEVVETGPLVTR